MNKPLRRSIVCALVTIFSFSCLHAIVDYNPLTNTYTIDQYGAPMDTIKGMDKNKGVSFDQLIQKNDKQNKFFSKKIKK